MSASRGLLRWLPLVRAFVVPGLLSIPLDSGAGPLRYELDLTPTATHDSYSWDHNVPIITPALQGNCDGACHTAASGDFAPSGKIDTPTRSGTFMLAAMKLRFYGDSANVKEYPDNATGDTASAQGHYLALGRATVTVPFAKERFLHVRSISVGENVCGVLGNGTVKCWGRGRFGGLGVGDDEDSNLPVSTFGFPAAVRQVAAHYKHSCAVTTDGAVWCWGFNDLGQLGNNSCPWEDDFYECFNPYPAWQNVALPGPAASVIVGGGIGTSFSCANLLTGSVWCWGGDNAQLPTQISGISNVTALSAESDFPCALRSDKTVWCWDSGLQGPPAQVAGLNQVIAVSASCALRSDRTVWCWYSGTPGQVIGLTDVASINGGCAVRSDGSVWCWSTSLVPTRVAGLGGIVAVSRGYAGVTCAARYDGTLWCWGENEWGQLGNPTVAYSDTPVAVLSGAGQQQQYEGSSGVYTGSFQAGDGLFVATDNSHHSIGIGSGWPPSNSGSNANGQPPPFSPTYPGGILSNQYGCAPGNPDDGGCGSNPSAIDGYDLRSALALATGHKVSNQDFPNYFPAKNGPLALVGGGTIEIDPISPTDGEHASVGYTGTFSATALTPMSELTVSGAVITGASVAFAGTFTLGAAGRAFAPAADDVVFGYGPYTAYLPAGTLQAEESVASYYGAINGSPVQISIRHLHDGTYAYSIAAQSVDLSALVAPANLDLYIGDNAGSAPAKPAP